MENENVCVSYMYICMYMYMYMYMNNHVYRNTFQIYVQCRNVLTRA